MTTRFGRFVAVAAVFAMAWVIAIAPAGAQSRTQVGVLECFVAGGTGFIIGSEKELSCTFHPAGSGPEEVYSGEISKLGIDIGRTDRTIIEWLVLAPSTGYAPRALAGTYVGASGEATIGVGLGANVLIGGFDRSIVLQPVSVQAQTGLNVALGVSRLTLR